MSNNDLISREALKKKIELYRTGHYAGTDYENGIIDGYDFCLDEINNAPSVKLLPYEERTQGDLISREALKKCAIPCEIHNGAMTDLCVPLYQIDNAPAVETVNSPK